MTTSSNLRGSSTTARVASLMLAVAPLDGAGQGSMPCDRVTSSGSQTHAGQVRATIVTLSGYVVASG